jgi:TrmH family RNA methyltransferase
LTSRKHALVERCRALARRREPSESVLLDGEHLVSEALRAGVPIEAVIGDGRSPALLARASAAGAAVYQATPAVLEAASPVKTPSRIVAIATLRPSTLAGRWSPATWLVALSGVQDPGNAGTIVRVADAFGATAVVALEGTADLFGWKALRASMGSLFRMPVARASTPDVLSDARAHGARLVATVAHGGTSVADADLRPPLVLLVGSEGHGLDDRLIALCDAAVTVPLRAGVESLNVAAAAAVVCYEARRRGAFRVP